jgi:hypothetical protein
MRIHSKATLEKIATIQDEQIARLEKLLTAPKYAEGIARERVLKNLETTKKFSQAAHALVKMAMPSGRMQDVYLTETETKLLSLYADMADSEV